MDVRGTRRSAGDVCGAKSEGGMAGAEGCDGREDEKTESRRRGSLCNFGDLFFKEDLRLPLVGEGTGLEIAAPGVPTTTGMESILGDLVKLLLRVCLLVSAGAPAGGALLGAASALA